MKIELNIDVDSAKRDCEIISQFSKLLDDFERMRNVILFKEVEKNMKDDENFLKRILDDVINEDCKKDCECECECKDKDINKIKVKKINSLDDLKEALDSLFDCE